MRSFCITIALVFLAVITTLSQVGISTDGSLADSSAMFDIKSNSKGFLLPRMTYDERGSISNPAEGLIVFCTNCGLNGTGVLSFYTSGEWYNFYSCKSLAPVAGFNTVMQSTIIWRWHTVPGALGYKWNTSNNLNSAVDISMDTSKTEVGVLCDTAYDRYVWSYNECGHSSSTVLSCSNFDCWLCGEPLLVCHEAGTVAPVNKTTSYGTVTNVPGETSKCWITSNLGSDHQATNYNDATEASAGWYWQFNHMQGFMHDGTTRTQNTTWITSIYEYSTWSACNDPCNIELANGWRIPTRTEWTNVDAAGGWSTWTGPWNSILKIHAAGRLNDYDGSLSSRGLSGMYWSSTHSSESLGWRLSFNSSSCSMGTIIKDYGFSIRCIKD
jgi:hypothetical protein